MDVRLNPTLLPKDQSNIQEGKVKDGCNSMYAPKLSTLLLTYIFLIFTFFRTIDKKPIKTLNLKAFRGKSILGL